MRLFLFTALTMAAFAANSVLNRMALVQGDMTPVAFGTVRLMSGAMILTVLVAWQKRGFAFGGVTRILGVIALILYIFGFSIAYEALDPGMGALILFAVVQITMFGGAVISHEVMPKQRWLGAGLALAGLAWLLWPTGAVETSWLHVGLMVLAGIGWGVYSLLGRNAADALQATAMNFVGASIVAAVFLGFVDAGAGLSLQGVGLAMVSGALMSGLGYALWYQILPELGASRAAVAQLSVPIIALAGGAVFLGEAVTMRFVVAAILVIVGVCVSLWRQ